MTMRRVGDLDEDALVASLSRHVTAVPHVLIGIGDDAACVALGPGEAVLTVDTIVEGHDWIAGRTPYGAVGHRAAAVNLSDLAAMGARPRALLCSASLPPGLPLDAFDALFEALARLGEHHGAPLCGGDLQRSTGPLALTVTALGSIDPAHAMRRSGAHDGDRLWCVGALGRAAIGLDALRRGDLRGAPQNCVDAHLWPAPLVDEGLVLSSSGLVHAAVDVSDGLVRDVARVARASGLEVHLEADWPSLTGLDRNTRASMERSGQDLRERVLRGGDDYALVVAVAANAQVDIVLEKRDVFVMPIGVCRAGERGRVFVDGEVCPLGGFDHFAGDAVTSKE